MIRTIVLACFVALVFQCCSSSRGVSTGPLTVGEKAKLDPQLHFLYETPSSGPADMTLDIVHLEGNGVSVGVKVFTSDAAKLKKSGIPVQSIDSVGAVCRVDTTSLRLLLDEPTVTKVVALKNKLPAK